LCPALARHYAAVLNTVRDFHLWDLPDIIEQAAKDLGDSLMLHFVGTVRSSLRQFERAESLFHEAAERGGFLVPAYVSRFHELDAQVARFLAVEDDLEAAAAVRARGRVTVSRILAENGLPKEFVSATCLYALRMNLWPEAEILNARWRHLAPDDLEALTAHAHLLAIQGHYGAAERVVRQVLERSPDHENATQILQRLRRNNATDSPAADGQSDPARVKK
jgi:hypothetical protein